MKVLYTLTILLVVAAIVQGYFLRRMWIYGTESAEYAGYLSNGIECLVRQNGEDRNDHVIAGQGKLRHKLKGEDARIFPPRLAYDEQIPECKKFFEDKCWLMTAENIDKCGPLSGLSQEDIDNYKRQWKEGTKK